MTDWDITPKILLEHMQAMKYELTQKIDRLGTGLGSRIDRLETRMGEMEVRLTHRIDGVERRLTRQIDALDQRLDAIEIENLPKRVAALEAAR